MSLLISTGDLRGNKFYLAEMANCIVRFIRHYGMNYRKDKKKEIVLAYKDCGHYCVAIQICHWLCTYGTTKVKQERHLARNDFDHDNSNIISSLKEMLTIGLVSCNM